MIRQRINFRRQGLARLAQVLLAILALALVWYGLMVVLLAVKVSPHTVNEISGYRSLYSDAASLTRQDFTTTVRLIAGIGGLLLFLVLLPLALAQIPRPYLARGEFPLNEEETGVTTIGPRVVERVAERAAEENGCVSSAKSRLGDGNVNVAVSVTHLEGLADALRDVQRRVRRALQRHELPPLAVNVTLSAYENNTGRELA